jgi:DNA-binding NarL/FixJ family response regulator
MNLSLASVLVVESHPWMREALCAAIADEPDLRIAGQVFNGPEVLEMMITTLPGDVLLAFKPTIILLGLGNPGLTDLEMIKTLRKSLPEIPILALTSDEVLGQAQAALEAGAQAVLPKAAPRAELICTLRHLRTV